MNRIKKILLVGIIVLLIMGLIYLLSGAVTSIMPKYQIYTIKVDEDITDIWDNVLVIKLNTITGKTDRWYEQYDPNNKKFKF